MMKSITRTSGIRLCGDRPTPAEAAAKLARKPICTFLPDKVRDIVEIMVKSQFLVSDYLASSMLAAAAAAIGNSLRARIFNSWVTNPALFMVLVGRPGIGKTAPMQNALRPIYDRDYQALLNYRQLTSEQKKTKKLSQTVVNDFTPEALIRAHQDNDRGVVVAVDEILGMFGTANRYNASPLIEQLLSAYSGMPLKVNRVSNPEPVIIPAPAITVLGSVQTARMEKMLKDEYVENGLIDRFLFVYPEDEKELMWSADAVDPSASDSAARQWKYIMNKLMSIPCDINNPQILDLEPSAWEYFSQWRNAIIRTRRDTDPDNTRPDKQPLAAMKLALIINALRWATGETDGFGPISFADISAGTCISAWMEYSFARVKTYLTQTRGTSTQRDILDLLDHRFKTADAAAAGAMLGMNERTTYRAIDRMIKDGLVERVSLGCYCKTGPEIERDIFDMI